MLLQEAKNEYSHLDPVLSPPVQLAGDDDEDEEEDIYDDLGDLDSTDLMQFAYQIATGMVRTGEERKCVYLRFMCETKSPLRGREFHYRRIH